VLFLGCWSADPGEPGRKKPWHTHVPKSVRSGVISKYRATTCGASAPTENKEDARPVKLADRPPRREPLKQSETLSLCQRGKPWQRASSREW
jgi:hypothetical protein